MDMLSIDTLMLWIIAAAACIGGICLVIAFRVRYKVLYRNDAQDVLISQRGDVRLLQFPRYNKLIQSAFHCDEPLKIMLHYQKMIVSCSLLHPGVGKIAIIGLGGGNLSMHLRRLFPKAVIDHWEINERMLDYAKRYFGFRPDERMSFSWGDACHALMNTHLEENERAYDLLILDAFEGYQPLAQSLSKDFVYTLRRLLSPTGVVLVNALKRHHGSQSEKKNYQNTFEYLSRCRSCSWLERNDICWAGYQGPRLPEKFPSPHIMKLQGLSPEFVHDIYEQLNKHK